MGVCAKNHSYESKVSGSSQKLRTQKPWQRVSGALRILCSQQAKHTEALATLVSGALRILCSQQAKQPAVILSHPPFPVAHELSSWLLLKDSHLLFPQLHSAETLQISSLATYSCLFSKTKDTFPVLISAACHEPPGAVCVSGPGNQSLHTGSEPQSTQCLTRRLCLLCK